MSTQWRIGKRSMAIALFGFVVLVSIYRLSWSPNAPSKSTEPSQSYTKPLSAPHLSSAPSPAQEASLELSTPRPSCTVTKVSMLYGSHKFSQLIDALDSHRRHSDRWDCGFETLDENLSGRKLYSKQYFILSTMLHEMSKPATERKQWLMWVDADSIIVNPAIPPSIFLPPDELDNVFALVTADHQGLNAGIFYLRVHESSLDLLTQTIDYPLAHPDEDLGWFGEQAAMANVIKLTEAKLKKEGSPPGIAWVPREWFNTYEFEHGFEGKPGHFMVHFAGLAETRIAHMADWLNELQQNQARWEIPPKDTFYNAAIPEFWKEFKANATKGS